MIGEEFILLQYVFDYGDGFAGAVGVTLRPISRREEKEIEDNAAEHLEELWQMAVEGGNTTKGLEEWADDVIATDGIEAILNLSYSELHDAVCQALQLGIARGPR